MSFKSGFVTIIGRPNVGKSTLLNGLTKEKVAITSGKPQTTRNTIKSIVTEQDYQVIFIDTPGIHKPKNELGKYMVEKAQETLNEVDVILFIIDGINKGFTDIELGILEILKKVKVPTILTINKTDLIKNKSDILALIASYKELFDFQTIIPISALNNEGLDIIIENIKKLLPNGPKYFPDDALTDQPERQIMAEIIREKMLYLLSDEIPHGIGVEVTSFKEEKGGKLLSINANIYCEKNSHKGMVIGKNGNMLKRIGTMAREDMEKILSTKVYLELWVKVKPDWRNSDNMLKTLGYK